MSDDTSNLISLNSSKCVNLSWKKNLEKAPKCGLWWECFCLKGSKSGRDYLWRSSLSVPLAVCCFCWFKLFQLLAPFLCSSFTPFWILSKCQQWCYEASHQHAFLHTFYYIKKTNSIPDPFHFFSSGTCISGGKPGSFLLKLTQSEQKACRGEEKTHERLLGP